MGPFYAINSNPPREVDPAVYRRQVTEMRIIRAFVRAALKAGYAVGVHNGEEEFGPFDKLNKVLKETMSVDDEHLTVYKDGKKVGWVYLVYGNDGYDVVSDYTVNLDHLMAEADQVADREERRV